MPVEKTTFVVYSTLMSPPTCLAGLAAPTVATRMTVLTLSVIDTLASGCVAAVDTSAREDAQTFAAWLAGESTTGTCNNEHTMKDFEKNIKIVCQFTIIALYDVTFRAPM